MNDCAAASVMLCAVRVSALDSLGTPVEGEDQLYVTDQFSRIALAPAVAVAEDIEVKNGCGDVCVTYRGCDVETWWTVTLDLCVPDAELLTLLGVGSTLSLVGEGTRGFRTRALRDPDCPDDVGLELWSVRVLNGVQAGDWPWWRWVLPRVRNLRLAGEVTLDNGAVATRLIGEAHENAAFFDGPGDDLSLLADEEFDRAWSVVRDANLPSVQCGYADTPGVDGGSAASTGPDVIHGGDATPTVDSTLDGGGA